MSLHRDRYLGGSAPEVLSWNLEREVAPSICEGNGPLVVRREGEIVGSFPWHCVPLALPQERKVLIRDMLAGKRVVAEFEFGKFDQIAHEPHFRVILLPRPGDRLG